MLVLLALAFAGGWFGRGTSTAQGADESDDLVALLDRGSEVISRVLAAGHASVALWRADGAAGDEADEGVARTLNAELVRLREVVEELEQRLGAENPLTVDARQAVEAAALIERELRTDWGGEGAAADRRSPLVDAYKGALSDARMRYVRGAAVARMVLRGSGVRGAARGKIDGT